MGKMYNILKADPAGAVWTNQHNNQMQTFFLTLEGVNDQRGGKAVMINRMAGSPLLSGQHYLELTETPSKNKPGTTYFKAKLEQAPPGTPSAAQQALPMSGAPQGPITWGTAVMAAATLLGTDWGKKIIEADDGGVPAVLSLARDLYVADVPNRDSIKAAQEMQEDILPSDDDVSKVNIADIPF